MKKLIIVLVVALISACVVPAPLGPGHTGSGQATTNCTGCTMQLTTKFGTATPVNFPSKTDRMYFLYDSVTRVDITITPISDQTFHVWIFDKEERVYMSPDVTAAAGTENKFTYTFKPKK